MRSLLRLSSATTNLLSSSCSKNILFLRFFGFSRAPNGDGEDATKSVSFKNPARADSVLEFLRSYGFTQAQMSVIIKKFPKVLSSDPESTLMPKFDFFRSKGFSGADIHRVVSACPWLLGRSIEGHIAPSFDLISSFIRSDDRILSAIRRYPSLLIISFKDGIMPKLKILQEHGVPEKNFGHFLLYLPRHAKTPPTRLDEIVRKAKEMGLSPSKPTFLTAVQVLSQLSDSTWDKKLEAYSRCGWSEEMTLRAFAKYPRCMMVSESKIIANSDYYTKEMGVESSYLSDHPSLMSISLEKRIIPRWSVISALHSKGLILAGNFSLYTALTITEKYFLEKFVARYPEDLNSLLNLYNEKMGGKANEHGSVLP